MPRHDVKLKINAEIPVGNVDVEIPVVIDEVLRGRLQVSTGSVDWRRAHSKKAVRVSWTRLAELLEEHGTPV